MCGNGYRYKCKHRYMYTCIRTYIYIYIFIHTHIHGLHMQINENIHAPHRESLGLRNSLGILRAPIVKALISEGLEGL